METPCVVVWKQVQPQDSSLLWAELLHPVPSKARALSPVWGTVWDIQLFLLWLNGRPFRKDLCLFSFLQIMAFKHRLNKRDVLNIKQRMPRRTCLQLHRKILQEVEKRLSPIFMKKGTSSNCIRLKKFFQTTEIIKHRSVTSGEVVNSSSLETFKNQLGKHLSKLTQV